MITQVCVCLWLIMRLNMCTKYNVRCIPYGGTYYLDFIISETINARLVQDHQMLHVTVDFVVIQAVTTHKHVRNGESNVIRLESTAAVSSLLY